MINIVKQTFTYPWEMKNTSLDIIVRFEEESEERENKRENGREAFIVTIYTIMAI